MTENKQTKDEVVPPLPVPADIGATGLSPHNAPTDKEGEKNDPVPQPAPFPVESIKLGAFPQQIHTYMSEYIKLADQKAAFFFALCTGLLAYLFNQKLIQIWITSAKPWELREYSSFAATIGLSVGITLCLLVTVPRRRGSKRGFIYFMAVAEYASSQEYAHDASKLTESDIARQWLAHTYELSKICRTKYTFLVIGLWPAFLGIFASLLLLIW